MIYGPSYVSLEWACQYYRLIPEKVTIVTSVTTQRSKQFHTPLGLFSYNHVPVQAFSVGVSLVRFSDKQHALVATKEKALVDLLVVRRGRISSKKSFLKLAKDCVDQLDVQSAIEDIVHFVREQEVIRRTWSKEFFLYWIDALQTISGEK